MDVNFVPLKRGSKDLMICGSKSSGKTLLSVFYILRYYLSGYKIFSNTKLNSIDYVYYDDIDFLESIAVDFDPSLKKLVFIDDAERWFNSRISFSKINQKLNSINLDFGKCNASTIVTAKRFEAIDKAYRVIADYFIEVSMKSMYTSTDNYLNFFLKHDFRFKSVILDLYDHNGIFVNTYMLNNLHDLATFYDTVYMVRDQYDE